MSANTARIAMVGFGEAARAFMKGWGLAGTGRVSAYDIKAADDNHAPAMREAYEAAGVAGHADPNAALRDADIVFCLVTADQDLEATRAAAAHVKRGAFWFDGNSCSPETKRLAAKLVAEAGGRYVDVAVMAPVYPKLNRTPLLVAGEWASDAVEVLRSLDMEPRVSGDRVGDASAIKMIRSVMIKGMEALTAECFLAARRAGVEEAVVGSLEASDPGMEWRTRGAYNLERMMVHGVRRAAEMREVAATLRELGLPDRLAAATAEWQDQVGALRLKGEEPDLLQRADRILSSLI